MTNELKYDPELPYVVYAPGSKEINSRFKYENEAFTHRGDARHLVIVDTTPKPKIPAGAKHITWADAKLAYSRYDDGMWYGWVHGRGLSDEELLSYIGDAEVTVLVRKEES